MRRSLLLWLLLALTAPAAAPRNLARGPSTAAFGNCQNGPFVIAKINDGRKEGAMAMWSSDGRAGAFIGVQLGERPVSFNTVRFYLFGERSTFTGWRIEGGNDCQIDEDTAEGTLYDPEVIATDADGAFANFPFKENGQVTITFRSVSYRYVRLVFPNKGKPVGVPEMEVYLSDDVSPGVALHGRDGVSADPMSRTVTISRPASLADVTGRLTVPPLVMIGAWDPQGRKLAGSDLLKTQVTLLARLSGNKEAGPPVIEYCGYTVVDATSPLPPPKPYQPPTRAPLPPKPAMIPASAPEAPKGTRNLLAGSTMTASISPGALASFMRSGAGDWFAGQRPPHWLQADFGSETAFNYISVQKQGPVDHFFLQTSADAVHWTNLVEVNHVRKNPRWNGCFETVKARYLRLVVVPPSFDIHIRAWTVANLPGGLPVSPLKPIGGEPPELAHLPPAL